MGSLLAANLVGRVESFNVGSVAGPEVELQAARASRPQPGGECDGKGEGEGARRSTNDFVLPCFC